MKQLNFSQITKVSPFFGFISKFNKAFFLKYIDLEEVYIVYGSSHIYTYIHYLNNCATNEKSVCIVQKYILPYMKYQTVYCCGIGGNWRFIFGL